jgi:phage terminase large subunit GpA-like protein
MACDINGLMELGNEDIRIDWEILAHTSYGQTYSIDHGSIGTFKRIRDIKKSQVESHENRIKWTLVNGSQATGEDGERITNCVWDPLEEIIEKTYIGESGEEYSINTTVIDTGHGEKHASLFIEKMQKKSTYVYGVKGHVEENGRKLQKDSSPVKRSTERPRMLYILEVDQLKDELSKMIKLRAGSDGTQPGGFMNYPQSRDGKYDHKNYFSHYESEKRNEVKNKGGEVTGYKWVKKNSQVQNHFWDVRIYNNAAPLVWLDLLRQSDPQYKNITWEEAIQLLID